MSSFMTSRNSGLALMAGVALVFGASVFSAIVLAPELVGESDFYGSLDVLGDNAGAQQLAGVLSMVSVILMGLGAAWLLRLPREQTRMDTALRVGVILMLVAWGVYAIELGMQHIVLDVAGTVGSGLEELAETILSTVTGLHFFGFVVLGAVSSFLVGLGVAQRFENMNVYVIAGYGLALKGAAEIINLAFSGLLGIDLGILVVVSNALLFLGGIWLFIIGYGIFQGRQELAPEGAGN